MPQPSKPKKPKTGLSIGDYTGRTVMPKNDTTRGRVMTGPEARAEQEKKTKKRLKGGYSGATRA